MVGLTNSCIDTLLYFEHAHPWPKLACYPRRMDSSILSAEINKFEVVGNMDETPPYFDVVPGKVLDDKGKEV